MTATYNDLSDRAAVALREMRRALEAHRRTALDHPERVEEMKVELAALTEALEKLVPIEWHGRRR